MVVYIFLGIASHQLYLLVLHRSIIDCSRKVNDNWKSMKYLLFNAVKRMLTYKKENKGPNNNEWKKEN